MTRTTLIWCFAALPLGLLGGGVWGFPPAAEPQDQPKDHSHDPVEVDDEPTFSRIDADFERPRRLLFDKDGHLLVVDSGAGTVSRRKADGKVETVADELDEPSGIARDADGNLYVAAHAHGVEEEGAVVKIAPDGKQTVLASGLTGPKGMAFDAKGNLYVANFDDNSIARIDKEGNLTNFASDVPTPAGLVFAWDGDLFAVNSISGTVSRITPDGEVSEFARGLSVPSDIAVAPDGDLIVANYAGQQLSRIDAKGNVSPYADVPDGTIALLFEPSGNLLLANWDHALLFKRTSVLSIPCPHCEKKIPVQLKGGEKSRPAPEI